MKTIFILCLLLTLRCFVYSQYTPYEPYYQTKSYFFDVYDHSGNKINVESDSHSYVSGTSLLNPVWGTGSVVLTNSRQVSGISLQFNIQDNTLYFRKDSTAYTFADQVLAFKMMYQDSNNSREVYFKSGYPDYKGSSNSFLYEVINDGPNVQFIKRLSSSIVEQYTYGYGTKRSYRITYDSYLYDVKKKELVKISNNKKSILKALPDYKEDIESFLKDNNANFKRDKDIDQLITLLNRVKEPIL